MTLKEFRDSVFHSREDGYHYSISSGKVYAHRMLVKHEYVCVCKDCDDVIHFRDEELLDLVRNINDVEGDDWAYFSKIRAYTFGYIMPKNDKEKIWNLLECVGASAKNEISFGCEYAVPAEWFSDLNVKNLKVPSIYIATVSQQARYNMIRRGYGIERLLYLRDIDRETSRYIVVCLDSFVPISTTKSQALCRQAIDRFCLENGFKFKDVGVKATVYI